jgi:hypothetical protein
MSGLNGNSAESSFVVSMTRLSMPWAFPGRLTESVPLVP